MKPNPEPVTGWESNADATSPWRALCEFYRAVNSRDLALLARNWAHSDDATMDDPMAGIRRGWPAIRDAYERLLEGPALLRAELVDYTIHETADVAWFAGRERGYVRARGMETPLEMRTTRVFRRVDARWRQVHCHASITDARLLERYIASLQGVFATPPIASPRSARNAAVANALTIAGEALQAAEAGAGDP